MKDFVRSMVNADRVTRRILRDEDAVTPELAAEVMSRLVAHLGNVGKSTEWAAAAMGVSKDTLEAAGGVYRAECEAIIRAIDRWLDLEYCKQGEAAFYRSGVAERIMAAGRYAVQMKSMVLVTGRAGIGKTVSARALTQETPGTVFITVKAAGITPIAVLDSLAEAIGRRMRYQATASRFYAFIENQLRDSGRLVIVDEVHRLASRRRDEALHMLRDLHDGAGVPMLLLGMPAIKHYIMAGRSEGESLDQLASRIGMFLNLEEDAQRGGMGPRLVTIEDIRRMLAARHIRVTPGAETYLMRLANEMGTGAFRGLAKLLDLAQRFTQAGEQLDEETLRAIQVRRLGASAAAVLETRMAASAALAVGA
jgi:DNA transposition AAA+ family ATPase